MEDEEVEEGRVERAGEGTDLSCEGTGQRGKVELECGVEERGMLVVVGGQPHLPGEVLCCRGSESGEVGSVAESDEVFWQV